MRSRPRTPALGVVVGDTRDPRSTSAPGARPRLRLTHSLLTHFVAGALGFVVAAGRLSLAEWRCHGSPGAGAAPAVPQLQHVPLPRRWLGWRRLAPRHRGAAPGHPQNGINERASARGCRQGCGAARAGTRRRCQVRGSTHWPQRAEEQLGPPSRLATSPLRSPVGPPAAELPQHGHAPQAPPRSPAPPRCTAVPRATPLAVTSLSGPRPGARRRLGLRKGASLDGDVGRDGDWEGGRRARATGGSQRCKGTRPGSADCSKGLGPA